MDLNSYRLDELMYFALQELEEIKEAQMGNQNIKYDLSFLIDIALDNNDKDLFEWYMKVS
jgi:hypothetical protein